jgi:type II pantothenate kinase
MSPSMQDSPRCPSRTPLTRPQIGGSLAKLVYFSREPEESSLGGRLNFLKFETDRIDACIEFMRKLQADYRRQNGSAPEELCIMATGGGAFKFYDKIRGALGVEVIREDEMECLIIGAPCRASTEHAAR